MFQTDLLAGRTVLITGGGTGLGRSMALRFAELGARLFLTGRREEDRRSSLRLSEGSPKSTAFRCSLRRSSATLTS